MSIEVQRVLVIGLPETGKSSFIHALDEVLKNPASEADLRSYGLARDRSYLQKEKAQFLAGEVLGRTFLPEDDTNVEMWFEDPLTGRKGELHLPDKKGEVFRDQWINRQWEQEYRNSLSEISGALLFVRADLKSRNDERIGILATDVGATNTPAKAWDMKEASAQVQVVDILQFISEHSRVRKPLRIAVMISAWDTVGRSGDLRPKEPLQFLRTEWALLFQYLSANPESFTMKAYGVSAYGGPPGALGDLLDDAPHERASLTEEKTKNNKLTIPLRWLLGW